MSAEEERAAELAAFMDDWYDRWAGPDERWTFEEMAAGIIEWQASREVHIPYAGPGPRYVVDTNELASREVTETDVERMRSALEAADVAHLKHMERIAAGLDEVPTDYLRVLARAALEAAREVRS